MFQKWISPNGLSIPILAGRDANKQLRGEQLLELWRPVPAAAASSQGRSWYILHQAGHTPLYPQFYITVFFISLVRTVFGINIVKRPWNKTLRPFKRERAAIRFPVPDFFICRGSKIKILDPLARIKIRFLVDDFKGVLGKMSLFCR